MKEITEPNKLRDCISHRTILRFTTRASDNKLLLGAPRQEVITEKNSIVVCRPVSVCAVSQISIIVAENSGERGVAKRKAKMLCTTDITENTFDSLKVINSVSLKKLAHYVNAYDKSR